MVAKSIRYHLARLAIAGQRRSVIMNDVLKVWQLISAH